MNTVQNTKIYSTYLWILFDDFLKNLIDQSFKLGILKAILSLIYNEISYRDINIINLRKLILYLVLFKEHVILFEYGKNDIFKLKLSLLFISIFFVYIVLHNFYKNLENLNKFI